MSEVMLHGVLNMPPELWINDPIDKIQRYGRYMQASRRIEDLEAQRGELLEALIIMRNSFAFVVGDDPLHKQEAVILAADNLIAKCENS